jgi:2-dehydro-3-deoxyphosphogluconate aldolase/(4S)-4-hydroxy-2-oxoglutarate aldolase
MPTGGVTPERENIFAWIHAGVACIGLGSKFITGQMLETGEFSGLTADVKKLLNWIQEARKGVSPI